MVDLKSFLQVSVLSIIPDFKLSDEDCTSALSLLRDFC